MTLRMPAPRVDDEPLSALNITPLIDVLLVLLVMMILTIPMRTHEVPVDLPGTNPHEGPPPVVRTLAIDAGGVLRLDGAVLAPGALPGRMTAIAGTEEGLVLAPDADARYEMVDEALATVRRAGVTRLGFQGNERFADAY